MCGGQYSGMEVQAHLKKARCEADAFGDNRLAYRRTRSRPFLKENYLQTNTKDCWPMRGGQYSNMEA